MSALQHLRWARFLQLPHEGVEEEVELRGPKVAGRDGESLRFDFSSEGNSRAGGIPTGILEQPTIL